MRQVLKLHPGQRCDAVARIEVDIARPRPGALTLAYRVSGTIADIRLPPLAAAARADELWRRTCFEAFVRPDEAETYFEFNFAPSTQWAAYRFSGYRQGMSDARGAAPPNVGVRVSAAHFDLETSLTLGEMIGVPNDGLWRVGLSAIIKETCGRTSAWALAHPPGRADFHHRNGFALELPAREAE